ncbi:MAG: 50S ribosomal protein L30 [Firmicutes bacterium]|nr:50S ribosomal protein L30 [Bacillota bacterium]
MSEKKIRIKLVKSPSGSKPSHRKTVKALGLRRLNHTVEHVDTPQIRGMIFHVKHLVSVE